MAFNILRSKVSAQQNVDYLVRLNVPALCARRDMAYDCATKMLSKNLMELSKPKRLEEYEKIARLLDEAKEIAHMVSSCTVRKDYADTYEQYLTLLSDSLQAATSLLRHEVVLIKEEKEMAVFIGGEYINQARQVDKLFSQSEAEIFYNILELIKIAAKPILAYRNTTIKKFSSDDSERYKKAALQFEQLYCGACSCKEDSMPENNQ